MVAKPRGVKLVDYEHSQGGGSAKCTVSGGLKNVVPLLVDDDASNADGNQGCHYDQPSDEHFVQRSFPNHFRSLLVEETRSATRRTLPSMLGHRLAPANHPQVSTCIDIGKTCVKLLQELSIFCSLTYFAKNLGQEQSSGFDDLETALGTLYQPKLNP